jgi:hypothetical protein
VLEFKSTEYGRTAKVVASEENKAEVRKIGINKCARESVLAQREMEEERFPLV